MELKIVNGQYDVPTKDKSFSLYFYSFGFLVSLPHDLTFLLELYCWPTYIRPSVIIFGLLISVIILQ